MTKARDIFIDHKHLYVKCYPLIILISVTRCDLYRNYAFLNNDLDPNYTWSNSCHTLRSYAVLIWSKNVQYFSIRKSYGQNRDKTSNHRQSLCKFNLSKWPWVKIMTHPRFTGNLYVEKEHIMFLNKEGLDRVWFMNFFFLVTCSHDLWPKNILRS